MEELTREEAVRRHRLMWNWIADEAERTHKSVTRLDAFDHFGWNIYDALSLCWCCEWAYNEWIRNKELGIDFRSRCCICPLDWSNGKNEVIKAGCSKISIHDGCKYPVLYKLWYYSIATDFDESSKLARIIANLPEKKEVKEND